MDYKEKYEMALEGIQEILSSGEDSIKMSRLQLRLQGIFPELKESEGEKIRKSLLEYLHTLPNHYAHSGVCVPEWLAWLEKQGKKETLCDKCRKEHPSHSCQDITALGRCALEQKPAWSEEDEKMFNKIAAHLSATCNGFPEDEKWANEFLNWFKILKERVQFQSKQEWTKEDKDRYISCLQRLNTGNPEQPETINSKWFKEHVYPQKQWNPTEEQMKALHELNLIGSISYAGQGQILIELYNDLKKLTK